MAIEGEMGEGKLWDYDLHVNDNEVPSPFVFNGGESSGSQLVGSSSCFEGHLPLDHQLLTDYDFSSFLEEFEKDYEQNPESHLAPNPSMVNDHSSSSEENPIARGNSTMAYFPTPEEIPSKNSSVHDLVSPFQETGKMEYIPTFVEDDAVMAEPAPYSSSVHQIASLHEEFFQEIVMKSNMVDSSNEGNVAMEETIQTQKIESPNEGNVTMEETVHTPKPHSSNEGNVTMEETMPNPVTLGKNIVPNEQEGWLDKIPCPTVTVANRGKPQVIWTPALHARFVRAVKHLGGCRSAKPKDILSLMNVEGLDRIHVASHLQKYRKGRFRSLFTCGYQ